MNSFDFITSQRILFGKGCLSDGLRIAGSMGKRPLLVHATTGAPIETISNELAMDGMPIIPYPVGHEPSVDLIQEMVKFARMEKCDMVIAFGGGSVMDAGKATSAMLTNSGDLLDYLEVVGKNQPLSNPAAPCFAIPTTAGTGAEVTRNAVLAVPEKRVKVSLRSNYLLPKMAIIDPVLTLSVPANVTAFTGLDALTQVIEPYVSIKNNPLIDLMCLDGIKRSAKSLTEAYQNGSNIDARTDLCLTSLFGGLALTNAGLGAVHGFAGPMGGMYEIPHGAVCGILLPHVFRANINALSERQPESDILARYTDIARLLTGNRNATMEQGADWLAELVGKLNIPGLSTYGIPREEFPLIIEKSIKASSMKANPITLTESELNQILENAY